MSPTGMATVAAMNVGGMAMYAMPTGMQVVPGMQMPPATQENTTAFDAENKELYKGTPVMRLPTTAPAAGAPIRPDSDPPADGEIATEPLYASEQGQWLEKP